MAITYENIGGFGNCLRISNSVVNVDVSTSFGPNILNFSFVGKEGFFYKDTENKCISKNEKLEENFGKDAYWQNFGGHRLWEAPEKINRTITPTNKEVMVTKTEKGAIFSTETFPYVNTKHETEIILSEDKAEVEILHRITNKNAWAVELAPWAITVLKHGGVEVMPITKENTDVLPNTAIALWPYTKLNDKRWYFGEKYIMLKPENMPKTKIGIRQNEKKAFYFIDNMLFEKNFDFMAEKTYPDFGMNFETYTDNNILECETVAPLTKIECEETACHKEVWKLYDNIKTPTLGDEEEVEKILNSIK